MRLGVALRALDERLAAAVARADARSEGRPADLFRGLHLASADIVEALAREPGAPTYGERGDRLAAAIAEDRWLQRATGVCELLPFESACLLLALAPEIDVRYERIFAYLQDDITRRRPTPALALDLLCEDAHDRARCAPLLADGAALFRRRILDAWPMEGASRLSSALRVDGQVLGHLLGCPDLDGSLGSWCRLTSPAGPPVSDLAAPGEIRALVALTARAAASGDRLVVHLRGPHGAGKLHAAETIAGALGKALLVVDLRGGFRSADGFAAAIDRAVREARFRAALLFVHGYDAMVESGERQALRRLEQALASGPIAMVAGTGPWQPAGDPPLAFVTVGVGADDPAERRRAWSSALAGAGLPLVEAEIEVLAARFTLVPAQITAAVLAARSARDWDAVRRDPGERRAPIALDHLARAARAQCGSALTPMARRITPRRRWRDLILPDESIAVLREISARVVHRRRVFGEWGFGARLSTGTGVTVLLAGPSGTGKTLAAEVIASDLDLDLFRIDLARVVSKYIGETEKNLDKVFDAARDANGVLLFDEAEALFGKRTDVRDAHDRYANLEIAYLLQKMEDFDGLAILSTNLRQNIDEAFTRRLAFTVHFPFPDEADRRRIWEVIWPADTPCASDVAPDVLARDLVLSGGGIKNAALAAAFYAAADGGVVTRAHVLHAARREFQKMGKVVSPREAS